MIVVCFLIVVVINIVLAFLCTAASKERDLRGDIIENRDAIISDLRTEICELKATIREHEELIAKSEELMQEYDAAFRPISELMGKYPNETKG